MLKGNWARYICRMSKEKNKPELRSKIPFYGMGHRGARWKWQDEMDSFNKKWPLAALNREK